LGADKLPTKFVKIGIRFMVQPRLEVVYICNMLIGGRGKGVLNLAIQSYMIIGTTSITSREWGT